MGESQLNESDAQGAPFQADTVRKFEETVEVRLAEVYEQIAVLLIDFAGQQLLTPRPGIRRRADLGRASPEFTCLATCEIFSKRFKSFQNAIGALNGDDAPSELLSVTVADWIVLKSP